MKKPVSMLHCGLIAVIVVGLFHPAPGSAQTAVKPASQQGSTKPSAGAASPVPAEPYRDVTPADRLDCSLMGPAALNNIIGAVASQGVIGGVSCQDSAGKTRAIPLVTTTVSDGKIVTRSFGTLFFRPEGNGSTTFLMKESQIKKLRTFLGL